MAYSRDAVLEQFGTSKTLDEWNTLQLDVDTAPEYAAGLLAAAKLAIQDGAFMTYDQGYNAIDFWLGGLAEKKVIGGMLGTTFDFIFAQQMIALQDGDRFYYLNRLGGTNLLAEIEAQLFSDVVMRNTGAQNLYTDIFSVADGTVYMDQATDRIFNFYLDFAKDANRVAVKDILGVTQMVGTAGWVLDADGGWTFYGNPGDYLDARGVFSPNGKGNASEVIVGNDDADTGDRINGLGGNDTIWAKAGNDTINGGGGNDFVHGGEGNDVITDTEGDDLIWGDGGDDFINAGDGLDQVFGGVGNDTLYGGGGADVIEGGVGDDTIYGDNGATPSLAEVSGDDVIAGGEGNDTIYGGGGNDIIDGGEGNDVIHGGAGLDGMAGGMGNDLFVMDAADNGTGNAMDGGLGDDTVDYSASNGGLPPVGGGVVGVNINLSEPNALIGADAFADVENLIGTRFNDTLVGGAVIINVWQTNPLTGAFIVQNGVRVLDLVASTGVSLGFDILNEFGDPKVEVLTDPVTGDRFESLVAENFNIKGGEGLDLVTGGHGNDTLDGGTGNDTLSGGLGNDVYVVDSNTDVIIEGVVTDVLGLAIIDPLTLLPTQELVQGIDRVETALGTFSLANIANVEDLTYTGLTNFSGTGNALNNVITGGAAADSLTGGAGIDTLVGGLGNDTYTVDSTTDVITELAGGGTDTVRASVSFTLGAEVENLTLTGNATNGTGNTLANVITGNGSANVLTSVANTLSGNDTLIGGGGNDTYVIDHAGVVITETAGNGTDTVSTSVLTAYTLSAANVENLIYTGIGNFAGTGSAGNNTLTGNGGNDTLDGAGGNDSLVGGAGNDRLIGGAGVDTLNGGSGNDTFVFEAGSSGTTNNRDRIVDFTRGQDQIDLSSFGALSFIGTAAFSAEGQVRVTSANNVTRVEVNTTGASVSELSVDLTGTLALTAADFSSNVTVVAPTPPTPPVNPNGPPVVPNGPGPAPAVGLNLTGTNRNDQYPANGVDNSGNDTMSGGRGNDNLNGGAGNDVLSGGAGSDVITGGLGNDILSGGTGADFFVFNAVLSAANNVDMITDFTARDDTIRLENAIFTALTRTGTLNANFFRLGTAAVDNNDYIIYDENSGSLWYDADGNGAGAQVLFATLTNNETLTRNDFVVI